MRMGKESGMEKEQRLFPAEVADEELEQLEYAVMSLASARSHGDRESIAVCEGWVETWGEAVARKAGAEGWEWLGWSFPSESDCGQAKTSYVRRTRGRHPGIGAARSGDAEQLRVLLDLGCPLSLTLKGAASPDLANIAAKERAAGAWAIIEEKAKKQLESGEDQRQQLMGWISGCVHSLWAGGIKECEEAFKAAYPDGRSELYWGCVFGSPMEAILCMDESVERPEEARETLRALLSLAPEAGWPQEREGEVNREAVFEEDERRFPYLRMALEAGVWWSLEILWDKGKDPEGENLLRTLREVQEEGGWTDREEEQRMCAAEVERLLIGLRSEHEGGLDRRLGGAAKRGPL